MKYCCRKLLLALFLLAGLAAAGLWCAMRAWSVREQTDFLTTLSTAGGSAVMDYQAEGRPPPRMPMWLRGAVGDWPYSHVVTVKIASEDDLATVGQFSQLRELDCNDATLSDREIKSICCCQHLQKLYVSSGVVDSSALAGLAKLHELISVEIPKGALDDAAGLSCFKHMPQIRTLRIADLDDKGLRRLRFLKQLEELDLHGTSIRGAGLSALSGMKHLRKLDLHGNPIIGEHLANLKDLDSLEELDLSNTVADDDSMAALAGLKNLKRLNVQGTKVRGPGLRKLYRLKSQLTSRITLGADDMDEVDGAVAIVALEVANFPQVRLTDTGFDHLTLYPMLEDLDLSWTGMDDAHAKLLAELKKLRKLNLANTLVTDAALEHLEGLKELRELHVERTRITNAGKQKLRAALPHVKIDGKE